MANQNNKKKKESDHTPEAVWKALKEVIAVQKNLAQKIDETRQSIDKVSKETGKANKETRQNIDKLSKKIDKVSEDIDKVSKQTQQNIDKVTRQTANNINKLRGDWGQSMGRFCRDSYF